MLDPQAYLPSVGTSRRPLIPPCIHHQEGEVRAFPALHSMPPLSPSPPPSSHLASTTRRVRSEFLSTRAVISTARPWVGRGNGGTTHTSDINSDLHGTPPFSIPIPSPHLPPHLDRLVGAVRLQSRGVHHAEPQVAQLPDTFLVVPRHVSAGRVIHLEVCVGGRAVCIGYCTFDLSSD